MQKTILTLVLAMLPLPSFAHPPRIAVATLSETASGFKNLAECERTLRGSDDPKTRSETADRNGQLGSLFNRRAGATSVCQIVQGEPQIVVYPRN